MYCDDILLFISKFDILKSVNNDFRIKRFRNT
jgi:hypothetical protein